MATAQNRGSSSAGCFQLIRAHSGRFSKLGFSWADRYDPVANVLVALDLYEEQGARPWNPPGSRSPLPLAEVRESSRTTEPERNPVKNLLKVEPVRLYSIAVAVLAVVAHYNPSIPTALYLGVVAALLGIGEATRAAVTPNARVSMPDGVDAMDHTG